MKRFGAWFAGLSLVLAGHSHAAIWDITGIMQGIQEVPSNESTASGSVSGMLDDETNTFTWLVQFSNLTGGAATLGHFHTGAVGQNGPALIHFTDQIAGQFSGSANGASVLSNGNRDLLIAGGLYANIHNIEFPGGEIRGQLVAALVPEPESWLMLALGAIGVGAAVRRKQGRGVKPA